MEPTFSILSQKLVENWDASILERDANNFLNFCAQYTIYHSKKAAQNSLSFPLQSLS